MIATMYIPQGHVSLFQQLVKKHDLRFCGNPLPSGDKVHVRISSEHLAPGAANEFFADWDRMTRPIVERHSPRWKRLVRRMLATFNS